MVLGDALNTITIPGAISTISTWATLTGVNEGFGVAVGARVGVADG